MGTGTYIRIGKKEDLDAGKYSYDAQHRVHSTNGIKLVLNNFKWFTVNVNRRFNNYLDFNPYTKIFLQITYFGLIEIVSTSALIAKAFPLQSKIVPLFASISVPAVV